MLEGAPEVGGKLRAREVGGVRVDVGAEAMLHRRPRGPTWPGELGLDGGPPGRHVVRGSGAAAALHPLPRTLMGVPLDLDDLAASGVLDDEALDRVRREPTAAADRPDRRPVRRVAGRGAARGRRWWTGWSSRCWAGCTPATPTRPVAARHHPAAGRAAPGAARCWRPPPALPAADGPGLRRPAGRHGARCPAALVATGRFEVRTGATVRGLRARRRRLRAHGRVRPRAPSGSPPTRSCWPVRPPPPPGCSPTSRRPRPAELAAIEYASMAVVTLAFRAAELGGLADDGRLRVPGAARSRGGAIKAATYSFAKWDWVREAGGRPAAAAHLGRAGTARRPRCSAATTSWSPTRSPTSPTLAGVTAAPGRQPRAAVGRRPAAVRRRPPRPGRADPGRRGPGPGAGGLRRGVRRGGHPGRHRLGLAAAEQRGQWRHEPCSKRRPRLKELNDDDPLHDVVGLPAATTSLGDADRAAEAAEVEALLEVLAEGDVVVRGIYDVSGLRADADVMVWWHAETSRAAAGRLQPVPPHRCSARGWTRSGRRWRCTGRRSSTRATSRRSSPTRSRAPRLRLPVRAVLRVVPPRGRRAAPDARRARPDGARLPRRPGQHRGQLRARRLRVDAGLRGRRAAPDRRPDAAPARLRRPPARARGGAVLHRRPRRGRRAAGTGCPEPERSLLDRLERDGRRRCGLGSGTPRCARRTSASLLDRLQRDGRRRCGARLRHTSLRSAYLRLTPRSAPG